MNPGYSRRTKTHQIEVFLVIGREEHEHSKTPAADLMRSQRGVRGTPSSAPAQTPLKNEKNRQSSFFVEFNRSGINSLGGTESDSSTDSSTDDDPLDDRGDSKVTTLNAMKVKETSAFNSLIQATECRTHWSLRSHMISSVWQSAETAMQTTKIAVNDQWTFGNCVFRTMKRQPPALSPRDLDSRIRTA